MSADANPLGRGGPAVSACNEMNVTPSWFVSSRFWRFLDNGSFSIDIILGEHVNHRQINYHYIALKGLSADITGINGENG